MVAYGFSQPVEEDLDLLALSADPATVLMAAVILSHKRWEEARDRHVETRNTLYNALRDLRSTGWGPQAIGDLIGWSRQRVADVIGTRQKDHVGE